MQKIARDWETSLQSVVSEPGVGVEKTSGGSVLCALWMVIFQFCSNLIPVKILLNSGNKLTICFRFYIVKSFCFLLYSEFL